MYLKEACRACCCAPGEFKIMQLKRRPTEAEKKGFCMYLKSTIPQFKLCRRCLCQPGVKQALEKAQLGAHLSGGQVGPGSAQVGHWSALVSTWVADAFMQGRMHVLGHGAACDTHALLLMRAA